MIPTYGPDVDSQRAPRACALAVMVRLTPAGTSKGRCAHHAANLVPLSAGWARLSVGHLDRVVAVSEWPSVKTMEMPLSERLGVSLFTGAGIGDLGFALQASSLRS